MKDKGWITLKDLTAISNQLKKVTERNVIKEVLKLLNKKIEVKKIKLILKERLNER